MAAPQDTTTLLGSTAIRIRTELFPHLSPHDAYNLLQGSLSQAARDNLERQDFSRCDCTCENGRPGMGPPMLVAPPNNDYTTVIPRWFLPGPICTNVARWNNPATVSPTHPNGYIEPSYCHEPRNQPNGAPVPIAIYHGVNAPPHHPHPDGQNHPLVCKDCKTLNAASLRWKKEEIRLGVCRLCRDWVVENVPVGDYCVCPPHEHLLVANGIQSKIDHLCSGHEKMYWLDIARLAFYEAGFRQHALRRWPKKKGHGWTHKKGGKVKKAPHERRAATREQTWGTINLGPPRCWCGEKMTAAQHSRTVLTAADVAAGRTVPETMRVRSCLGCNQWRREY